MKTYKVNNVEVSAEQIKEIIKHNPELLEESKGGRYFLPKEGDYFFYISEFPNVQKGKYFDGLDRERVSVGVSLEDFTAFRAANKEHLELLFKR